MSSKDGRYDGKRVGRVDCATRGGNPALSIYRPGVAMKAKGGAMPLQDTVGGDVIGAGRGGAAGVGNPASGYPAGSFGGP